MLPLYQHPSTVVIVDDSRSFLDSLRFQLGAGQPSRAFADGPAAIAWLRAHAGAIAPEPLLTPAVDAFAPQPLNVALRAERILRLGAAPRRFATPTVLVADYAMPGMDGVALCAALADLPCKKILLTGTADERIAIAAFNRGLIDRYLRKSEHDALDRLEADLAALQRQYFLERAAALRALLPLHGYGFVDDPAIAALLARVAGARGAVEHYLSSEPAGLLLVDADGARRLLAIETEQSMQAHLEVARDDGAPRALLEALAARVVVPNFVNGDGDGDGMYCARFARDWYRHTAPAQVCEGRQRYYWAEFAVQADDAAAPPSSFNAFLRAGGA